MGLGFVSGGKVRKKSAVGCRLLWIYVTSRSVRFRYSMHRGLEARAPKVGETFLARSACFPHAAHWCSQFLSLLVHSMWVRGLECPCTLEMAYK